MTDDAASSRGLIEPLLIRSGARYHCFGDGLCCTDVHAIGALEDDEVERLKVLQPEVVGYSDLIEANILRMRTDGTCPFLGDAGCIIHEPMDGLLKPHPCWRFPFGLTATPDGGRVTTEHRCPCRTMGERPPIEADGAVDELRERDGRIRPNHRVGDEVPFRRDETIPFADYLAIEGPMLRALLEDGASPESVLAREPFPDLIEGTWGAIAGGMQVVKTDSRFDAALVLLANAIQARDGGPMEVGERPWRENFDRAEARVPEPEDPEAMIRDWVADSIWCLYWTAFGSFEQLRSELATRVWILRRIAQALEATGTRPDVAVAEGLMVVDLVGTSEWWEGVTARLSEG
ncbi:MAG: YkgJ family cysteine cluster protein [Deltaproteobacteria bacterium]|nr:YkgJ family cysteine cluster protein [Deltaproteobacteria bacterium]